MDHPPAMNRHEIWMDGYTAADNGRDEDLNPFPRRELPFAPRTLTCWCGGSVGAREPGDDSGLGCLDSIYHDWSSTGDPEKITRLYLAGPMSGYPQNNYPVFNEIAAELREHGYEVVNPAEFGSDLGHYVDLLRHDLKAMLDCHAVAFHGDWWLSTGARNEVHVAGLLRMPVLHWREWVTFAPSNPHLRSST